jgi:hypothetical protein
LSYFSLILKADAADSSVKAVSFPEEEKVIPAQQWTYVWNGTTGLLPLDIHHLSPAASMTLFIVHHLHEATGAKNASPRCKMNLLVKISGLLIR